MVHLIKIIQTFVRSFLEKDRYVTEHRREETLRTQRVIGWIASVGFLIMSYVNLRASAKVMLVSTLAGAVVIAIGLTVSYIRKSYHLLWLSFYAVLMVIFPLYTLMGGNDGFAALWMTLLVYLMMYAIDFRAGFLISLYYQVLLVVAFDTPLKHYLLGTESYTETFLVRFPLLFLINFAFATYIVGSLRVYQYNLMIQQEKLENLSIRDLNTGVYNRNAFIELRKNNDFKEGEKLATIYFDANGLHELNNAKGHAEGDKMLRTLATACKQNFPDPKFSSVYRLGGDEFLVFCRGMEKDDIEKRLNQVIADVEKQGYSTSAGMAFSHTSTNLNRITESANEVMLANKANYYKHKEHDRRHEEREMPMSH